MAKIIFYFSVLIICTSCATTVPVKFENPIEEVITDLKGDKSDLFVRSIDWMIYTFRNSANIIEYSDKEEGVIIGKYIAKGAASVIKGTEVDNRVYFKVNITVKENKAKISVFPLGQWSYRKDRLDNYGYTKTNAIDDVNKLIKSYRNSVSKEPTDF